MSILLESMSRFHAPLPDGGLYLYLMRILDGTPVEQKIQALKGAEDVEYAEPNVIYSLD